MYTQSTERECVVCVLDREGSRVFARRAQVAVQTAVYLTSYSD